MNRRIVQLNRATSNLQESVRGFFRTQGRLSIVFPMLTCLLVTALAFPLSLPADPLEAGFHTVPDNARMRMYWRVFGPAWQRSEIDYQLDEAKAAGLGGLTVYFMYPVALDDPSKGILNLKFGSPEFLDSFAYAAQQAKKRGLSFGVNGGTGWPYGGANVSIEDSAHKLQELVVEREKPLPRLTATDRVVAAFDGDRLLTLPVSHDYRVQEKLRLYVESPTGQQVKRASYGGEGLVLDHFNEPALKRWLESTVQPVLNAAKGEVQTLGCDSLEVYGSNWARDLPDEFKRRRGYELLPNLPHIFSDGSDAGLALRFDYWRTLMELTEERFTEPLADWSDRHRVSLEMEAYGTPPNPMTAFRRIRIPTGEHYEWRGFAIQKYVASAAHMAKRNIIGCEAWTWAGLPNRLADTLSDIKLVSDMEFLAGANDLTGVDFPYSPRSAGQPGWQPYYGPTMNQNNPQWEVFPGLVEYINRCQWMLRQGSPQVSLALYLPVEDALPRGGMEQMQLDFLIRDHFVTGKATSEFGLQNSLHHRSALIQGIFQNGLDYDGIDFWALDRMAELKGPKLVAGTSQYSAVVLPNVEAMETKAASKLRRFVEAGGLVVASRRIPTLRAGRCTEAEQAEFRKTIEWIFGAHPVAGVMHSAGKGRAVILANDEEVGPFLASQITPQLRFSPCPDSVSFVHRRAGDREIYFLANVQTDPVSMHVSVPNHDGDVEAWDAVSGEITRLPKDPNGEVAVTLSGRGSLFLVVRNGPSQAPIPASPPTHSIEWNPTWHVHFDGPDAPHPVDTDTLESWTSWPGGRYFSGIGIYQADLVWQSQAKRARLAFDGVYDGAKVFVNGRPAGYVYNFPFEIEVGALLKPGTNRIEIRVGNLPVNRFLGLPDDDLVALRAKYGGRFSRPEEKQLMKEPAPSGLIGKVRILTD